jgi:hypothetical protein
LAKTYLANFREEDGAKLIALGFEVPGSRENVPKSTKKMRPSENVKDPISQSVNSELENDLMPDAAGF